jgi:hypothetical protein
LHPYREGTLPSRQDDEEVRAFARRARSHRRRSLACALAACLVASVAILDWPLGWYLIEGVFVRDALRWAHLW